MPDKNPKVRLVDEDGEAASRRIDPKLIGAVEVVLEAHLGSATMTVLELTNLKAGDSVSLDSALNQDVELRLNGATIARGELVSVGNNFGVRITDIVR